MATCANCEDVALYDYELNSETHIYYCSKDLPRFLYKQRDLGILATTPEFKEAEATTLASLAPVEVDEPVVEPTPAPKKSTKKSTKAVVVEEEPVVAEEPTVDEPINENPEVEAVAEVAAE